MTELERRALLGDKQAQYECTKNGVVLVCPKCFSPVTVCGPEDWEPTFYDPFYDPGSGGDPYEFDCKCGVTFSTNKYDFKESLADWNTRPAPPIGRCGECKHGIPYKENHIMCKGRWTDKTYNDFCSDFEPKED